LLYTFILHLEHQTQAELIKSGKLQDYADGTLSFPGNARKQSRSAVGGFRGVPFGNPSLSEPKGSLRLRQSSGETFRQSHSVPIPLASNHSSVTHD